MKQILFAKATKCGKLTLSVPDPDSDFSEFESLMLKFGEFPYLLNISQKIESLQKLREARLLSIVEEVETSAKSFFGPNYKIKHFVLMGEFNQATNKAYKPPIR